MTRVHLLILVLFCYFLSQAKEISVNYFEQQIVVICDDNMIVDHSLRNNDVSLRQFCEKIEGSNYTILLQSLSRQKNNLKLNDWFYFLLVKEACLAISNKENVQIALCWFILNKLGYNIRLRFVRDKLKLYAYSKSTVFATDSYNMKRKTFMHLKWSDKETSHGKNVLMSKINLNKRGRAFDFSIHHMPVLTSNKVEERKIIYTSEEKSDSLSVLVNKTYIEMLSNYPPLNNKEYFELDFSNESKATLIPYLKQKTKNYTKEQTINYLLSFVRTGFRYGDDSSLFGEDRALVAEEVLYYPISDCEDKSALFFWLVKNLLDVDMVVLLYPDHINIAVLFEKVYGKPFNYKNQSYTLCEPSLTGDKKSAGIGFCPAFERYSTPTVIEEYHPNKK